MKTFKKMVEGDRLKASVRENLREFFQTSHGYFPEKHPNSRRWREFQSFDFQNAGDFSLLGEALVAR